MNACGERLGLMQMANKTPPPPQVLSAPGAPQEGARKRGLRDVLAERAGGTQ